jgi:glucose-6-phosphate 1-dehydrogenase
MNNKAIILIIIGISGDLSKRKLLPAISEIKKARVLSDKFKIVGVTRQSNININDLLEKTKDKDLLHGDIELFQMDLDNINDYKKLEERLIEIEKDFEIPTEYLFYLSVPPKVSESIIELIGQSGLAKNKNNKILLEKPFGTDLRSADELIGHINKYFKEDQVYRIDHYLAKDTTQNIIVFREGNSLFKKTWNKNFIDKIEITVSEEIGIEGRIKFYEETGALRDFAQSHLLQLASLVLMELPEEGQEGDISNLRLLALKNLNIKNVSDLSSSTKRGQYKGYIDEVNNKNSLTETFISIDLESKDPKWEGVVISLKTGKALKAKFSEIKISYKKDKEGESNELVLLLGQEEGISFGLWVKKPGYEYEREHHALSFHFKNHYESLPEAYEQVFFSAINGDHSLFTSNDEVLETWRILDPLQKYWENNSADLIIYEKGSDIESL